MAQRLVNAENDFIAIIERFGDVNNQQARKVFEAYKKAKMLNLDAIAGRYTVKHGGYLNKAAIRYTLSQVTP